MTPYHRKKAFSEIKKLLAAGKTCRVVSTSLVEAGVDVDFPTVYRELAGQDSIVQAAGRCNREGKRPAETSEVFIFETEANTPRGIIQNCAATRLTISKTEDIAGKQAIEEYFNFLLYTLKGQDSLDTKGIMDDAKQLNFQSVSDNFHIIEGPEYTVYVPCPENEAWIKAFRLDGPNRYLLRKLGPHAVNLYADHYRTLMEAGVLESVADKAAILTDPTCYDNETGIARDVLTASERFIV